MLDPLSAVRESCRWVTSQASHVSVHPQALQTVAEQYRHVLPRVEWNFDNVHFYDGGPLTAQYILVVDALNFCFWPDPELHYEHLARGLKRAVEEDLHALDADQLAAMDGQRLRGLLQWPRKLPLEEERVRLVNEVGRALALSFQGQAANLVRAAGGSAARLVELVTAHFPGFRDQCVYRGRQIFLYKRAQIFVGDLWGALKGEGLGSFSDIEHITMFADYLVPAVLRDWGILSYSTELATKIDQEEDIQPGSEEEAEIRACCISATEDLRSILSEQMGHKVLSVELDWFLWSKGLDLSNVVHHRTNTIYY